MRVISFFVMLIILAGAIYMGLKGFFGYDYISAMCKNNAMGIRITFCIIGLAGVWGISFIFRPSFYGCHNCSSHHDEEHHE